MLVRLSQPVGAFLLAQQRGGEYRRIVSDQHIIARVREMASVDDMMDLRMLEILQLRRTKISDAFSFIP